VSDSPEKEKGYRLRETDLRLSRTKSLGAHVDFQTVEAKVRSPLTYRDLRLQGFTGTRYDAEMLIEQGLPLFLRDDAATPEVTSSHFSRDDAATPEVTSSHFSRDDAATPEVRPKPPAKGSKHRPEDGDAADLTVTVRSLRNTPSRLRARCERGRIISDCSSSGISDDTSSSGSGSDRDSGIEMSSSNDIERGVERMNLNTPVAAAVSTKPAAITRFPATPPNSGATHAHVKLTLRMKRSPVLDEVIACGNAMPDAASPGKKVNGFRQPNYEVVRMEGLEGDCRDPEVSFSTSGRHHWRRGKRHSAAGAKNSVTSDAPGDAGPKTKRLRLVLGNETMSTIDLNSIIN
jgi:hypothetical protein